MSEPGGSERAPSVGGSGGFEVGEWHVEPSLHVISRNSESVHLEPRVMHLLVYLAAAQGRVVPRSELLDEVWGDVVVNEEAVSRAVSELRKALTDDPGQPRYVQTIHKSGYRLLARVSAVGPAPGQEARRPKPSVVAAGKPSQSSWSRRTLLAAALMALAVATWFWWRAESPARSVSAASTPLAAQLLTAYPGREIDPAIDRSGQRVVFAWNGAEESDEYDLYVRRFGATGEPVRITSTPGFEGHPAWSPDGESVAFVRQGEEGSGVWLIPALGGEERKLFDLEKWSFGLDWFPDGRSVVVSQPGGEGGNRLVRLSLDAAGSRDLTAPDSNLAGDYKPAVSPDGAWIAFVRSAQLDQQDVWVVSTEDGQERQLSQAGGRIRGVDWSPDSRHVIYSSDLGGGFGLWRAAIDSRGAEWLPMNGQDIYNPVVAATGRLVFESISYQKNLWELDLSADPEGLDATRLAAWSTRQETFPALSPDGLRLAFVSNRTGQRSLWLSSIDGSDPRPLTRPDEAVAAGPVWSPEGSRIAIALVMSGYARPFIVEVESGSTRPLFDEPVHAIPVAWSRDGVRIYLASDRGGKWNLWSIGVDGERLERLTADGGLAAAEDESGTVLYYTRPGDPAFYALPLDGEAGSADLVAREVGRVDRGHRLPWSVTAGSIYSVVLEGEGFRLVRLDPVTGFVEEIARPPGLHDSTFSLSRDARRLIYSRIEQSESDLLFIDGAL